MSEEQSTATGDDLFNLKGYAPTEEERIWSLAAHLSPLLGISILGPILALVIKGKDSKWVRAHAIESLNFNLTCLIAFVAGGIGMMFFIGICIVIPALLANLVLGVVAAVNSWQGKAYRYPVTLRLIKD